MIPKIVVTLALMAVQTAMTMSQKIRGPRLDNLKTTTADYGTPIPRFWGRRKFECPVIWAADLIETQHTSKTMGGKNTQYTYYADFAVLICDHAIDAVAKVWMDDKLVYQATDKGPVSMAAAVGITDGGTMRVYLGSETQGADPLIEAWTDDKYGANSCPAYRGSSYVVFNRLPIANFGNRIPNVTIEAISSKTTVYPYDTVTSTLAPGNGFAFSPAGDWLAYWNSAGTPIEWWNTASRTSIGVSPAAGTMTSLMPNLSLTADGTAWFAGPVLPSTNVYLFSCVPGGSPVAQLTNAASSLLQCTRAVGGKVLTAYQSHAGYIDGTSHVAIADCARDFCVDDVGDAWMLTQVVGVSSSLSLMNLRTGATVSFTGASRTAPTAANVCYSTQYGHFLVICDGDYFTISKTPALIASGTVGWVGGANLPEESPGRISFWSGMSEYSLADGSLIRTLNQNNWVTDTYAEYGYEPLNNAIWARESSSSHTIHIMYLDRIGSNGVTLQTVVDSVAGWCGLTGQDTSALTQTILGYSVSQGTGKDMIGPLLDIHDVDCRPHDFIVQFVNRGSAPSVLILTQDFVRGTGDRYTVTIKQDTDLARKLTFNFADYDHEQQPNNAIAQRPFDAVDTTREETVDLSTYADTVDGAQQKADRYLRRSWISRTSIKNALTAQHLALEPGDVTTLSLEGAQQRVKLTKLTSSATGLDCEWMRDEPSVAVLSAATAGAPASSLPVQTISIPSATKGFILDAPLVRDADNDVNPQLYYAAGSYGGTWPGAAVMEGFAGDYATLFGSIDSTHGATWGLTSTALATANPNLWDRGNSLSLSVYGTLTSQTEAAINADPSLNLVALGDVGRWEYIQFATATLTGTSGSANLYTLTGFKRGRRGTEGNVASHTASDALLVLSGALPATVGTDTVGEALTFKVQTSGRDVNSAPTISLTFAGDTLKPYAPASVKWAYDGTNLTGTITRRTRVGGNWSSAGGTIALGETPEAYEVDIYNGVTFKRTIALSGTNVFTYTATMATADGITLPTPPSIKAYQLSSAVGRGFALAA